MNIAAYRGTSGISRAIRWVTRSDYSHIAIHFDIHASYAATKLIQRGLDMSRLPHTMPGAIIEAWDGVGVRNCKSLSDGHGAGTVVDIFEPLLPMLPEQEEDIIIAAMAVIGEPYNWKNCLKCDPLLRAVMSLPLARLLARILWSEEAWFCSELAHHAFSQGNFCIQRRVPSDQLSPRDIAMSPALGFLRSEVTR